jgi:hypothetical protein
MSNPAQHFVDAYVAQKPEFTPILHAGRSTEHVEEPINPYAFVTGESLSIAQGGSCKVNRKWTLDITQIVVDSF